MSSNNNKAYYKMEQDERKKINNNIMNQNLYNQYFNYPNNNNFQQETLLQKTKNSVSGLIKYNDEFKNSSQYPGERIDEIKIRQQLLPVYQKIFEIKEDLNKFSELSNKNNAKNVSNRQFNEMQSLHTNIVFNKNLIDDTINYMKEKIENVQYEQIHKEFEEITSMLETLNIEMENMVNDFNNKYEKIIKEKKRQKIAEDLLNGNYNKNPEANKYDLLNKNDNLQIHKNIDDDYDIDYNRYKDDINQLNVEKENLMLKYLEEKQRAINGLPKLVPPNEKVSFKYEIQPPNYDNDNNIDNNNINNNNINNDNNKNNINNINDDDNIINNNNLNNDNNNINNSINDNNNLNNNNNIINTQNRQPKENGKINHKKSNSNINNYKGVNKPNGSSQIKKKKSVNFMEGDYNNPPKENKDLTETMNDFQKKMNMMSNQIITGQPKKNSRPKIINSGPTKADYLRNIQPRSNASRVTYQEFKRKKPERNIIDNKYNIKPNRFKVGRYPNEEDEKKLNDFVEQHPQRPIKKEKNLPVFDPSLLESEIKRIVDLNVKKALAMHGGQNQGNNDELLKILIQKFDDIEDAIRETKNQNGIQAQEDINELLANEIFNKIYSQINNNININITDRRNEQPIQQAPQQNISINQEREEIPQNINIFEDNKKVGLKELDQIIPAPRNLNVNAYDEFSETSSVLSESLRNKNELGPSTKNIEITKININDNRLFYENNVNRNNINNNIVDNSMSKGEVRSESEEDSQFENNNINRPYFRTDNNYYNKNKTGNDLLILKYYNENLPENYYYNNLNNNINNIPNNNNINNINNIPNYNKINNINRPEINIDNNELLKQYNLYGSDEYNSFKNKFQENMNNYKTQSNFGINKNPNYNSTYTQMRPIQNNQNLINTMGSLKIAKVNNKDIDEIDRQIQRLKIKNEEMVNNLGLPNIDNIQNINDNINNQNNINNRKNNDDDNNEEYSLGEVRSDESY